ncbi:MULTISPECIES: DUF5392 family protein [Bacillaceae]|uniref:YwnF family protein n=1 Tax=Evansella alkalicola TaxID=745819 RepID=A0ABS6JQW3_9BACI|nr:MULTISPECIES: DUF5392 family protein [Bacillaceae]MBU9720932.1 YwnF family protein [Bacillus alkalicola]
MMKFFKADEESPFVKKELAVVEGKVSPYMKKNLLFGLVSIPLIFFSIINLYTVIIYFPMTSEITFFILILAVAGALGFAFFKESKHYSKKMQETSLDYIQSRISNSEILPDPAKEQYLDALHEKPYRAFKIFHDFLKQEEKLLYLNR